MGKWLWLWILVVSAALCGCASDKISDQTATAASPADDPPIITVTEKNPDPAARPPATIAFDNRPTSNKSLENITVPTSAPITLRLTTGTAILQGNVIVFPSDTPLPNAHISITPAGDASTLNLDTLSPKTAHTAPDGSFTLPGLSAGPHRITVKTATGQPMFTAPGQSATFHLNENETTATTIRVFPGYRIDGFVFDKETSEPITAAEVTLNRGNTPVGIATTSSSGEFNFDNIEPHSSVHIAVSAAGFIIPIDEGTPAPNQGLRYPVKFPTHTDHTQIQIPMIGSVTVSGRVIDTQENAVPNAKVEWTGDRHYYENLFTTMTDTGGRFSLELLPFQNGVVEVTASGYAPKRSEAIRLTTNEKDDVLIVLETGASARGRVVGPDGTGISSANVFVDDSVSLSNFTHFSKSRTLATTAPDGSFSVTDLQPDKDITLKATASGYATGQAKINVGPGEEQTGILIRLPEELTIEGRVLGPKDEPVSAVVVLDSSNQTIRTDAQGNFRLTGLLEGEVFFRVHPNSPYTFKQTSAEAGTKDLIIRVEGGEVTALCTVVDEVTNQTITDFEVDNVRAIKREGPGQFSITLGRNHILKPRITAEGYITKSFRISSVSHDEDFEVTLEMGSGSGVTGRTVNSDGEPIPNIPVAAFETEDGDTIVFGSTEAPLSNTVSAADGTFVIAGIQSGKVRVTAMPEPPTPRVSKTASLVSGKIEDLGDFVLGETSTITGRIIRLSSQQPVPDTNIHISGNIDNTLFYESVNTDNEGRFRRTDLAPGKYSVSALGRSRDVDLEPGKVAEVNFELGDASLSGRIIRREKNAQVLIDATNLQTGEITRFSVSIEKGTYNLRDLTPGEYTIRIAPYTLSGNGIPFHMEGFEKYTETINITEEPNQTRDFVLP